MTKKERQILELKEQIKFPGRLSLEVPVVGQDSGTTEVRFNFPLGYMPTFDEIQSLIKETNSRLMNDDFDVVIGQPEEGYTSSLRALTLDEFIEALIIRREMEEKRESIFQEGRA